MENQHAVQSPVGEVVDVATPSSRKLRALGLLWTLIALSTFVLINYLIVQALGGDDPILSTKHPASLVGSLLIPLVCWYALGAAIQRFHAASFEDRHFRSGPGGVSVRLPDDQGNTFLFSFRTVEFDLPWEQIKTWYPFVQTMNGIPTDRAMIFETIAGRKFKLKTYHFAEPQKQITANITRARSMSRLASTPAVGVNSAEDETSAPVLPTSTGDVSIQFKKKKEPVKEIDLQSTHISRRGASIERIADGLEAKLVLLFGDNAGFKVTRKRYQPFKEWKDVFGIRLFVRRGLLDGYELQIEPNDSESRKLTISMCSSTLIDEIRKYVSIAVGATCVLISLKWASDISHWLGDFSRLTPLVLLALFVVALGLCTGILTIPIRLARLLVTNKQTEEAQKREIRVRIKEMAI